MYVFLISLLLGFALNSASAFTAAYSRRWGEWRGQLASVLLRDVLGMPMWVVGLALAMRTPSPMLFISGPAEHDADDGQHRAQLVQCKIAPRQGNQDRHSTSSF